MPARELKRFTVVVSFSKAENNSAWSARTVASWPEVGVAGSDAGDFLRGVDDEAHFQQARTQHAASAVEKISVATENSSSGDTVGVPPGVQNVWVICQ